jgi:hypothetical protein
MVPTTAAARAGGTSLTRDGDHQPEEISENVCDEITPHDLYISVIDSRVMFCNDMYVQIELEPWVGLGTQIGWLHVPAAVIKWCLRPYVLLGLSLPGGVKLVMWTTPAVID